MFTFLKSVFSEEGEGSYSRCASGALVLATIVWVSHVVLKTHALPDLTGPSAFIVTSVGTHYGINKGASLLTTLKGAPDNSAGA